MDSTIEDEQGAQPLHLWAQGGTQCPRHKGYGSVVYVVCPLTGGAKSLSWGVRTTPSDHHTRGMNGMVIIVVLQKTWLLILNNLLSEWTGTTLLGFFFFFWLVKSNLDLLKLVFSTDH